MGGDLSTELALPRDFEAVAELVREEDLDLLVLGNDAGRWREQLAAYEDAGFTHVALHDVSQSQSAFLEFARQLT
jgi:hypothetical protein